MSAWASLAAMKAVWAIDISSFGRVVVKPHAETNRTMRMRAKLFFKMLITFQLLGSSLYGFLTMTLHRDRKKLAFLYLER